MKNTTVIEISPKSVIIVILICLGLFVAWEIRGVLIALYLSYIWMCGAAPLVDWLQKKGFGKPLSVGIAYLLAILILGILVFSVVPPLIEQIREFINKGPVYFQGVQDILQSQNLPVISNDSIANIISSRLDGALSNALTVFLNVFGVVVTFVTVAVFTFYLLLERESIKRDLFKFFPSLPQERVYDIAHKIEVKMGSWVRGELVLMFIVGFLTYIGLSVLRIEFAVPLAVIAGLLEVLPTMGPIIAAIPALIIAFVQAPILVIPVLALYVLIQQLENNLIVPKVMQRAVGFSPLIVIISLLVGGTLFGVVGALLAVPTAAIVKVIFDDYHEHRTNSS